jgi:hypothetical protein
MLLLLAMPAGATLTDDEPLNDDIATAPIQIVGATMVADVGKLALIPGDTDYVGIGSLIAGDTVTVSTTPVTEQMVDDFENPDTIIGIFDVNSVMECLNDDAFNNDLDTFPMGYGSLCRFRVVVPGDYFVGVTGFSGVAFDGTHSQSGNYVLSVNVVQLPEPGVLVQLGTGLLGLGLLDKRRRRKSAA